MLLYETIGWCADTVSFSSGVLYNKELLNMKAVIVEQWREKKLEKNPFKKSKSSINKQTASIAGATEIHNSNFLNEKAPHPRSHCFEYVDFQLFICIYYFDCIYTTRNRLLTFFFVCHVFLLVRDHIRTKCCRNVFLLFALYIISQLFAVSQPAWYLY